MEIRLLQEHDAAVFRDVRLRALKEHPEAFGSSYEEQKDMPLEKWQERLRPSPVGDNGYFGAFDKEELVGIIGFFRQQGAKVRHKATIISMYVPTEYRGKGIARDLMKSAIAYVKEKTTVEQLQLAVVTSNQNARRLYERMGFIPFGEEKRALNIGDRYYDECHMVLHLER